MTNSSVVEPAQTVLQLQAKRYSSEASFDPTNLIKSDKFGVSPSNTVVTVVYRKSNPLTSNVAAGTINTVQLPIMEYENRQNTIPTERTNVVASMEVFNQEPLTGEIRLDVADELRRSAMDYYATQNRAVSALDYQALIYAMPSNYGKIKRCSIFQDNKSFKRNINIYVISQTNSGALVTANSIIKSNLKTWISQYKMINDTVDILDAKIVNYGIEFNVISDSQYEKTDILNKCLNELYSQISIMDIGESISVANIYNTLNKITGVIDTTSVIITPKVGGSYSNVYLNFDKATTYDGKYVNAPKNVIFELKFPISDIKGTVS